MNNETRDRIRIIAHSVGENKSRLIDSLRQLEDIRAQRLADDLGRVIARLEAWQSRALHDVSPEGRGPVIIDRVKLVK